MAKTKKSVSHHSAKQLRARIAETLAKTFTSLKKIVGDKKFERNIRKASKVLASASTSKSKTVPALKKKQLA